jgi:DNA-binding MarR family transcriptional regulator
VRQPHPVHGRSQQLYVANAGEVRHAEGARAVAQVEERLLAGFTLDERNAFAELLSRALATFSRD